MQIECYIIGDEAVLAFARNSMIGRNPVVSMVKEQNGNSYIKKDKYWAEKTVMLAHTHMVRSAVWWNGHPAELLRTWTCSRAYDSQNFAKQYSWAGWDGWLVLYNLDMLVWSINRVGKSGGQLWIVPGQRFLAVVQNKVTQSGEAVRFWEAVAVGSLVDLDMLQCLVAAVDNTGDS